MIDARSLNFRFTTLVLATAIGNVLYGCGGVSATDQLLGTSQLIATGISNSATAVGDSALPLSANSLTSALATTSTQNALVAETSAKIAPSSTNAPASIATPFNADTQINPVTTSDGQSLPSVLLQSINVTDMARYLGTFRMPIASGPNPYNFSGADGWGGGAIAWFKESGNNGRGSLIVAGRAAAGASYLTEITIPLSKDLSQDASAADIVRASFLVPAPYFFDLAKGQSASTAPGDSNWVVSGGVFVANGNIYQNWGSFYYGLNTTATHFMKTGENLESGTTSGPFSFESKSIDLSSGVNTYALWYRGANAKVPAEWTVHMGGEMLQGQSQFSNTSPMGYGPAIFGFSPSNIGLVSPVPNTALLGYSETNPIESQGVCQTNDLWMRGVSSVSGIAFPSGSSSILISTLIGKGTKTYGSPDELDTAPGHSNCGLFIVDPIIRDKGYHAYPYINQILAYNANDLKAVKEGSKKPYEIKPYATWSYKFPGLDSTDYARMSMAYDDKNRRLFVIERESTRTTSEPLVHVYQLAF
jgi:hypothetical protein